MKLQTTLSSWKTGNFQGVLRAVLTIFRTETMAFLGIFVGEEQDGAEYGRRTTTRFTSMISANGCGVGSCEESFSMVFNGPEIHVEH